MTSFQPFFAGGDRIRSPRDAARAAALLEDAVRHLRADDIRASISCFEDAVAAMEKALDSMPLNAHVDAGTRVANPTWLCTLGHMLVDAAKSLKAGRATRAAGLVEDAAAFYSKLFDEDDL